MSRRGATGLRGILLLDKPAGMTSHDVVARVRRATGEGRIGHAGTLDPAATGLLVVLVGPYTRLEPYLSAAVKRYDACVSFGAETDTDDAEGETLRSAAVPPDCLDEESARLVLSGLVGASLQTPPAFSAIKVGGRVSHRAARAGKPLHLEPRAIEVFEARLIDIDATEAAWHVAFTVSKGTYVRALARDIGRACGSAAHLSALRRTASGGLQLEDAHTLEEVEAASAGGRLDLLFTDPLCALGLPVAEGDARAVATGSAVPRPADLNACEGARVSVTAEGRLAGVYVVAGDRLVPAAVLPKGEAT